MEFVETCESRYAPTYSFCCGRTQEDILCLRLDDPEQLHYYQELRDEYQGDISYRIYDQNPLQLGFFLSTIKQEGGL